MDNLLPGGTSPTYHVDMVIKLAILNRNKTDMNDVQFELTKSRTLKEMHRILYNTKKF